LFVELLDGDLGMFAESSLLSEKSDELL
jgi:hypothetical protein